MPRDLNFGMVNKVDINVNDKKKKRYHSPSSKAPIMTPIKIALYNSKKQTKKFIEKIRELMVLDRADGNVEQRSMCKDDALV